MAEAKMSTDEIKEYCRDRLKEIRAINAAPIGRNPSGFVCIAAFMGFLSRLAYGTNKQNERKDREWFVKFVKNFMPSKYEPHTELMYSTFRCGIIHAMSFDPEITIAREKYSFDPNRGHAELFIAPANIADEEVLRCCNGQTLQKMKGLNSYVLVASVLCDDIESAIDKMFSDTGVQKNSVLFASVQRPIEGMKEQGNYEDQMCARDTNNVEDLSACDFGDRNFSSGAEKRIGSLSGSYSSPSNVVIY